MMRKTKKERKRERERQMKGQGEGDRNIKELVKGRMEYEVKKENKSGKFLVQVLCGRELTGDLLTPHILSAESGDLSRY